MSEVDSQTLDLYEALEGISYPEETFDIYLDSKSALEIYKANRALDAADPTTEDFKVKEQEFLDLVNKFKGSKLTLTIRGISREHYNDSVDVVIKEAEAKSDLSQVQISQFIETRSEQLLWSQHIVKIEDSKGRVRAPITDAEATALYNRLPDESRQEVVDQIAKMRNLTAQGYETGISDFDFLSEPSQEG